MGSSMHFGKVAAFLFLSTVLVPAGAQESFDAHVARAKKAMGSGPDGLEVATAFMQQNLSQIQAINRKCFEKRENAVNYVLVLDIQADGSLSGVDITPRNARTSCIATEVAGLHATAKIPAEFAATGFPFTTSITLTDPPSKASPPDQVGQPVERALGSGDVDLLNMAFIKSPLPIEAKEYLKEAISGDTARVEAAALKCRDAAYARKDMATTKLCAKGVFGYKLANGDFQGWARELQWALRLFPGSELGAGHADIDAREVARFKPLEVAGPGPQAQSLPRVATGSRLPIVTIKVNGKDVRAVLDTGVPLFLVLDDAVATRLGVRAVSGPLALLHAPGDTMTPRTARLAVSDQVEIGSLRARNVGTVLGPKIAESVDGVEAIVGLSALQKFPSLKFEERSVVLGGAEQVACANGEELRYSPYSQGGWVLLTRARIDRAFKLGQIDTGLDRPLMMYGREANSNLVPPGSLKPTVIGTISGRKLLNEGEAGVGLQVGDWTRPLRARVAPEVARVYGVVFGAYGFPGAWMTLDFASKRICLSP